jgi:hypothetical protein
MDQSLRQLEAAMWQGVIFQAVAGAIVTTIMFYVLYLVVKAAVRDGVREGLGSGRRNGRREPETRSVEHLPDMRAD